MDSIETNDTENSENKEIDVANTNIDVIIAVSKSDDHSTLSIPILPTQEPDVDVSFSYVSITLDDIDTQSHDKQINSLETVVSGENVSTTTNITTNITTTTSSSSPLTDLFISILKAQNPDLAKELNLNKEMVDCLLFILNNHPSYFSDFGTLLSLILEDGKINLNDVPHITLLVSKTYEFVFHFKKNIKHINEEKTFEVCANIMKTVFHILIMKNVIHIKSSENKVVLVNMFNSVVDSCVHLAKLNYALNSQGCACLSFFKSKFKSKSE